MNLVSAELVRDAGPAVTFAGMRLPVPAALVDARPRVDSHFAQQAILGVGRSDFEDDAFADGA